MREERERRKTVAKQEAGPAGKCARPLEPEMNFAASSVVISTASATSYTFTPSHTPTPSPSVALLLSYFLSSLSPFFLPLFQAVAVALCLARSAVKWNEM